MTTTLAALLGKVFALNCKTHGYLHENICIDTEIIPMAKAGELDIVMPEEMENIITSDQWTEVTQAFWNSFEKQCRTYNITVFAC